ncbi:MAG: hypothetical protein ABIH46_11290 [Chloroflexota bacterium]
MRWANGELWTWQEKALLMVLLPFGALLLFALSYPVLVFWLLLPVGE